MPPLTEWTALIEVQAGAAATLTGLVFVAASINLSRIIAIPGLPSRVAESLFQFLQIFFICTAMLIPRQPVAALGAEVLALALASWVYQIAGQIRLWPVTFRPSAVVAGHPNAPHGTGLRSFFRRRGGPVPGHAGRSLLAGGGVRLLVCQRGGQLLGAAHRDHALSALTRRAASAGEPRPTSAGSRGSRLYYARRERADTTSVR